MSGKDIQRWADEAMFEAEPMERGEDGRIYPKVYLVSATPDPLGTIAAMAKMYKGEVVRILKDVSDEERRHFWEEVKKTHLKAPLEAVDLHFMIENVTRSFTHQMVRQRTAVYAQESLRFAVKEDAGDAVAHPPSLMGKEVNEEWLRVWDDAVEYVAKAYTKLVHAGMPAEDARGLLPHNITTRLNYKTNLRNLLDHAGNRLCTQAQFEWRMVFSELVKAIGDYKVMATVPNGEMNDTSWQFQHIAQDNVFKPVCYDLGHCPFTADFDRGCTIRGRVEEGKFDQIDPREWMMDPAAARRGG